MNCDVDTAGALGGLEMVAHQGDGDIEPAAVVFAHDQSGSMSSSHHTPDAVRRRRDRHYDCLRHGLAYVLEPGYAERLNPEHICIPHRVSDCVSDRVPNRVPNRNYYGTD